jgi:hypothetical protein
LLAGYIEVEVYSSLGQVDQKLGNHSKVADKASVEVTEA